MDNHQIRIIFMGTPDFAVTSLNILVKNGYDITAVVTAPDKRAGRGLKMSISAVKEYAVEKGLRVLQPKNLKSPDFIEKLNEIHADLYIVVAFRILPEIVYSIPPKGAFNLHASLLPDYRGAAPINWVIINGEKETGVSTFFIEKQVDTGNIIFQDKVAIGEDETAGELHNKLKQIGARLVLSTVEAIEVGAIVETEQQDTEEEKKAPKIFPEHCKIDFEIPTAQAYNFIRGLSPHPAAWFDFEGKRLKVYKVEMEINRHGFEQGNILTDHKSYFKLAFPDGLINILELQLEGKKRMETADFLRGIQDNY